MLRIAEQILTYSVQKGSTCWKNRNVLSLISNRLPLFISLVEVTVYCNKLVSSPLTAILMRHSAKFADLTESLLLCFFRSLCGTYPAAYRTIFSSSSLRIVLGCGCELLERGGNDLEIKLSYNFWFTRCCIKEERFSLIELRKMVQIDTKPVDRME